MGIEPGDIALGPSDPNRDRVGLVPTRRAAKANSYPPSNTDTLADAFAQTHTDAGSHANPNTPAAADTSTNTGAATSADA